MNLRGSIDAYRFGTRLYSDNVLPRFLMAISQNPSCLQGRVLQIV